MHRFVMLLVLLCPVAAADPVAIEPTADAHADFLAVSGTGDAHSSCRTFGTIPCVAASGTGNASGAPNRVEAANARACVTDTFGRPQCVVDGARGDVLGLVVIDPEGDAQAFVAVAPGGRASGTLVGAGRDAEGALALGSGDARGLVAVGGGSATGFLAISRGEARTEGCLTTPIDPCIRGLALALP